MSAVLAGIKPGAKHIPGEPGIWVFIGGDMMVFTLFFGVYTWYRAQDVALYTRSQALLHIGYGAINTLLLLTSSLFVALAVHAVRSRIRGVAPTQFALALACGVGFGAIKFIEYGEKIRAGITLTTNDFFMYYFVLTGIHFMHVIIGMQLFQRLGLQQGDTLIIWLENHIRYAELCWAAKNSGITYACISSQASVADAAYIVKNSDAKLLISSSNLAEFAVPVARNVSSDLRCLMIDGAQAPFECYDSLLEKESATPLSGRRRGPSMLYSSGTTGRPKGVRTALPEDGPEIPPRRFVMLQQRYGLAEDTVLVCPGPFYHAAPGRFMMSMQRAGGTLIGFRRFDAQRTLDAIEQYEATHGLFVPTMFIRLLDLPEATRERYARNKMRCVLHLGAPCPAPVKERMIEWWGPIIEEMYSGTEAVGHTMIDSQDGCATRARSANRHRAAGFASSMKRARNCRPTRRAWCT